MGYNKYLVYIYIYSKLGKCTIVSLSDDELDLQQQDSDLFVKDEKQDQLKQENFKQFENISFQLTQNIKSNLDQFFNQLKEEDFIQASPQLSSYAQYKLLLMG